MSVDNRTWSVSATVMCVGGALLIAASWLWTARTATAGKRELQLSLQAQTAEIARLREKLEALVHTCASATRVSQAVVGLTAAAHEQQMTPEQLRLSAAVRSQMGEAAAPPPLEPTPANLAAAKSAQELVNAAIATKHWTEADRERLRLLAPQMSAEQFAHVQRQLAVAMNAQELRPDFRGPPF